MKMKWKKSALVLCAGAVLLSSCHTALYHAAKAGDVATVRREIVNGADVNESAGSSNLWWQVPTCLLTVPLDIGLTFGTLGLYNECIRSFGKPSRPNLTQYVTKFGSVSPAEIAWRHNKLAVLDELAKAGAGIAPASAVGKRLDLVTRYATNTRIEFDDDIVETPAGNNLKFVDKYWRYGASFYPSSEERLWYVWDTNSNVKKMKTKNSEYFLAYNRVNYDEAIVRVMVASASTMGHVTMRESAIQLYFDTPTSGRYYAIEYQVLPVTSAMDMVRGRFQLR